MSLDRVRPSEMMLAGLVTALSACGEKPDESDCRGLGYPYYCQPSIGLALRTTTQLTPSDDEVFGYYRKLRPAYEQEPVLRLVTVDNHYTYLFNSLEVATSEPALIDDLRAHDTAGHASELLLADAPSSLRIVEVGPDPSAPDLIVFELTADFGDSLSWRVLRNRATSVPNTYLLGEERASSGMDILYAREGAVDVFDLSLGWGDCSLGCINVHQWRVRNEMGLVSVEDLGGSPVEPGMIADALALPPLPDV